MGSYKVYLHKSPSGKVYIGITKRPVEWRWGKGGCSYYCNTHFWNAIRKYGWDNFEHRILAEGLDKDSAVRLESCLIHQFKATNPEFGYNHVAGPCYPTERSPELIERLNSPEFKKRVHDAISKAAKGRRFSEAHRQKLSLAQLRAHQEHNYSWVSRSDAETIVRDTDLDSMLQQGWNLGRKQSVYVHKDKNTKRICSDQLDNYLEQGWVVGKSDVISENIKKSRQQYIYICDGLEFRTAKDLSLYLREHYFPNIVASTITSIFRGSVCKSYPNLKDIVQRYDVNLMKKGGVTGENH